MEQTIKRNRILAEGVDVFSHNAWDDIKWTSEMLVEAKLRIQQQLDEHDALGSKAYKRDDIETAVPNKWDSFYKAHGDKFFKDRRWIRSEFPEIFARLQSETLDFRIFEVGCGVGNAVTQILESNSNPKLEIYCCDLSQNAIETLKKRDVLSTATCLKPFQADICKDFDAIIRPLIAPASLDIITLIFTLSALKPDSMQATISNLASLLKPGGLILFRDYAQFDLSQLRFKGGSYLSENYYVRADGTTSYFFTKELVDNLFSNAGLTQVELKDDNRLLINRLKSLKMCRCWIQAKYCKPI